MRPLLRGLVLILALAPLEAQVQVRIEQGRTIYQRPEYDRAYNAYGIGWPPKGTDRVLWFAYDRYIKQFCLEQGVDPAFAKAVIWAESRFRWRATSPQKARGLMQVIDGTAARMGGYTDARGLGAYDPIENLRNGIRYLGFLQNRFRGNLILIAAAYNAGEKNVEKHGGVPPFEETRAYVPRVLAMWSKIDSGGIA